MTDSQNQPTHNPDKLSEHISGEIIDKIQSSPMLREQMYEGCKDPIAFKEQFAKQFNLSDDSLILTPKAMEHLANEVCEVVAPLETGERKSKPKIR